MKKELLGLSINHNEQINPLNDQYSIFFEILRLFDWRTEPINTDLTNEVLTNYKNILIGEPHNKFSDQEIDALREWINRGGNILIIGSLGGDSAPSGDRYSESNIGHLLNRIQLYDNSLGIDKGVTSGRPFDTKVITDISHLVGVHANFCYDTGCTFNILDDSNISIEHTISAPKNSSIITGVRLSDNRVTSVSNPYPKRTNDLIYLKYKSGLGSISLIGSSFSFKDDTIIRESNILFTNWLIVKSFNSIIENYITEYVEKPQRHRLLHGYPFPNLMQKLRSEEQLTDILDGIEISKDKPYIIGVLPHTFCNPMVKGCGFCTFPHETYNNSNVTHTVNKLLNEIDLFTEKYGQVFKGKVQSIYFGGGTANLTPLDQFDKICEKLKNTNNCSDAEVTLEGVPKYFERDNYKYLDILSSRFNPNKIRLSIGVQTLDEHLLTKMGRQNFGDKNCIKNLVEKTKEKGIGISGDLLFNLPGQTIEMMKSDVHELIEMDFKQISIYHLVMFRGLGPEWSKDSSILSSLPRNTDALSNWLQLRELLLSQGYEQRTLTNFQKESNKGFEYEECVFQPESFNWIGFGPSAISSFFDDKFDRAIKLQNPERAQDYNDNETNYSWEKYFTFDNLDMKVLYITRKIALLSINKENYKNLFNSEIDNDFSEELYCLNKRGLIENLNNQISLTSKGMFYADTVAGLFALRKVKHIRMLNLIKGRKPNPEEYYYSTEYNASQSYRMG